METIFETQKTELNVQNQPAHRNKTSRY